MDPFTALALGAFLILVIGAFVGFVHATLPASVQPAAKVWRIANLILAAGVVILAVSKFLPETMAVVLSNALLLIGMAGFMHALKLFYQQPTNYLQLYLPSLLIPIALYWFTAIDANFQIRVFLASSGGVYLFCLGLWTLVQGNKRAPTLASRILIGAIATTASLFLLRAVVFGLSLVRANHILDSSHWANALSAIAMVCAPVIFTIAFLLMCVERIANQWREAASTDYLTGLPNRRTFSAQLEALIYNSPLPVAVAILDVDHFKQINDRFGHDVGDIALKAISAVLVESSRSGDLYARLGGEEFALAFNLQNTAEALQQLDHVRLKIAETGFPAMDQTQFMTASFGVAIHAPENPARVVGALASMNTLLKQADQALYQAKQAGRNRVMLVHAGIAEPPKH
jgi:diguanylate cyclase (GGDEF)-like protein